MHARGFPPIGDEQARVLILGSLPGLMSLRMQQYYAQPQNAFWTIMGRLFDAGADRPYDERLRRLIARRVAVWDVCAAAERPGSLDSAIVSSTVVPNDFATFFASHPHVRLVCFNGAKAASLYRRLVHPSLPPPLQVIRCETLPSTSPAHAAIRFEQKLASWSVVQAAVENS